MAGGHTQRERRLLRCVWLRGLARQAMSVSKAVCRRQEACRIRFYL